METMGSYFADLAKKGKLNEVNNEELQDIMKKQAESLGFSGVEITVNETKSETIQEDEFLNSWTPEDEEKAQKLLNKLSSEPHFEERMELGKFLMRHIDDLSEEERKRYDELLEILDSEYKIEKIDVFKDENHIIKTGIDLISEERQQQIEKHNYSTENDLYFNSSKQLSYAALMLLSVEYEEGIDSESFPDGWNEEVCYHMISKSYKERLVIAGALIAAEIDRINSL